MKIQTPLSQRLTAPSAITLALCLTGFGVLPQSSQAESLSQALTQGKVKGDIRLRYETVEQDNTLKDATAGTLRTRLGYTTGKYKAFSAFVEMESLSVLGNENYDSTRNDKDDYSIIADPSGAEMNQASLSYTGISDTTIKWGRQRIILDNARFVGNVGWRQNEQTLDAFSITNNSRADVTGTYAYVYNVNGITLGDTDVKAHILNISYRGLNTGTLTGYGYFLDFVDTPSQSQQTLGLRFSGKKNINDTTTLLYTAEYAQQTDYQDGDASIDASYLLGELGATLHGVTAKLGYEVLGGDGNYGFSTPLATKHAFNGWSDRFLNTPDNGLTDLYVSVSGQLANTKLTAVYHDFSADEGNTDYGSELNLVAAKKLDDTFSILLKYASYSADTWSVDTDKLWLQGQAKF